MGIPWHQQILVESIIIKGNLMFKDKRIVSVLHLLGIFLILFIPTFFNAQFFAIGDGEYYWSVAYPLSTPEGFNIAEFPYTFRGYFLPTFFLLIQIVSEYILVDPFLILYIFHALFTSVTIVYLLPYIFNVTLYTIQYFIATAVQAIFVVLFWTDFIINPLSDLIAVLLLILGTFFAKKVTENHPIIIKSCFSFFAGLSLYLSYNTRTIYFYSAVLIILYLLFTIIKKGYGDIKSKNLNIKNFITRIAAILLSTLLGVAIVAFPQSIINYNHIGDISPRITTERFSELYYPNSENLQEQQVFWGVSLPRYETYVGPAEHYGTPAVRFYDKTAQQIIEEEGITEENFSYTTLFDLLFDYPLDIIAIYARHIVSALTPIYSEAYINDLHENKTLRVVVNILLWIITTIACISRSEKNNDKGFIKNNWFIILSLISSCFLTLAGAIEIRFFIVLHLLMYFYVTQIIDYKKILIFFRKHWLSVLVVSATVFLLWVSSVSSILSGAEYITVILS